MCLFCLSSWIYFKFSYILWEIWKFISPALTRMKRKMQRHSSFFSSLLSLLSAVWLLYLIPMSVNFVATFKVRSSPQSVYIRLLYCW
jgi:sec-independent protein translocase protein TatC